jgi:hypothetical protein
LQGDSEGMALGCSLVSIVDGCGFKLRWFGQFCGVNDCHSFVRMDFWELEGVALSVLDEGY